MLALHQDRGVVIGVDTHKDTHTAAAVGATGAVLEHLTVSADPAGYRQLDRAPAVGEEAGSAGGMSCG